MSRLSSCTSVLVLLTLISVSFYSTINAPAVEDTEEKDSSKQSADSRSLARAQDLVFTEYSSGLPTSGSWDFIVIHDFNNDSDYDLAFSAQDGNAADATKTGLYAYTGNGGTSWTNASGGLWRGNSWAGIDLGDADEDGYVEYYATDDNHGTNNNSGVKVFEYRSGSWTDSTTHVTTPLPTGRPNSLMLINVSGTSRLDLVVCNNSGMKYFENQGGNPVTWRDKSTGLPSSGMYTALDVADMNKDGLADIVCCDYSSNERLFIQNTSGNFHWSEYSSGFDGSGRCLGVELEDVNNDTHMDIIFGCRGGGLHCSLGNSGGASGTSFSWTNANTNLPTGGHYYDLKVVDIDLDGDMDIVTPSYSNIGIRIYLGNGNTNPGMSMTWTQATNTNLTQSGRYISVDCVDINSDGSPDIAAASWGSGVKVYLNNISLDVTAPGATTNLAVENITTTSIEVNWTAPSDNGTDAASGPVKAYDIRYHSSTINTGNWASATECAGEPVPAAPGTKQKFNITGLQPGTLYYIAMRYNDERPNYSPLSNVVSASTLGLPDTTPPGKIYDLQAINPTNNSINLTWTAPADNSSDISSGAVSSYDIRYYSSAVSNGTWSLATQASAAVTPSSPGTKEAVTVSGLSPETTYYFAVKAADEKPLWGFVSNSAFNTTLVDPDVIPPSPITDLQAIQPTNNSINLTWTAVGDDSDTGTATEYDIRYATATITATNWAAALQCDSEPIPQAAGNAEHFTVKGLQPETTYYFAVKVSDETPTWTSLSNLAFNTTLPDPDGVPPGRITDLEAGSPATTSITLSWTAPGDDGYTTGTASEYNIRYSTSMITDSNWVSANPVSSPPVPSSAGEPENFVANGLSPSTTYYFGIKAADEGMLWSPLSNIASETTLDDTITSLPELFVTITPLKMELNSSEGTNLIIDVKTKAPLLPAVQATVNLSSDNADLVVPITSDTTDETGSVSFWIVAPVVDVKTDITITAEASKAGYQANLSSVVITVNPLLDEEKYDLEITEDDIDIPETIEEDDPVDIEVLFRNLGPFYAYNIMVNFYIDDQKLDSRHVQRLQPNATLLITFNWTAIAGNHTVKIELIPSNIILELDYSNNAATVDFTVDKKSIIDDDSDGDNDDDDAGKDTEYKGNTSAILAAIIIIIILIVILLLFFMMRRKKRQPYAPVYSPPPPPAEPIAAEPLTEQISAEEAPMAMPLPEAEPAPLEGAEPVGALPPGESVEEEGERVGEEEVEKQEEAESEEETIGEEQETAEEEPKEESSAQEPESQPPSVPCPTCQNQITAYGSPCSHCGTDLKWS